MLPRKRYHCRACGVLLPAWLPVAQRPDGAMLLAHLSQQHPDQVGPYLERMRTEDIGTVAAEVFEVEVVEPSPWRRRVAHHINGLQANPASTRPDFAVFSIATFSPLGSIFYAMASMT
jgi:hypothetical protein